MAEKDKALLMKRIDGTLRTRMFANLLEEAEAEIQDHLTKFDITHISDGEAETEDLLTYYLDAKRASGKSEQTIINYHLQISKFMEYAGVKTNDVTKEHVLNYFSHEQARGLQDSSIRNIRSILLSYFNWLEREKLIRDNPMIHVDQIKCEKKERPALSAVDMDRLKRNCKRVRDIAIINFLFATGCRIGEVVRLNRRDINFADGEVIVYGKGRKERTVFLDSVSLVTLKEYLATRTDDNEALFIGQRGKRLDANAVRYILNTLSKKSNVDHVYPHRFRRTTITYLLDHGMGIEQVALLVGHEKVDTTMKYFAANKSRIKMSYRMMMD